MLGTFEMGLQIVFQRSTPSLGLMSHRCPECQPLKPHHQNSEMHIHTFVHADGTIKKPLNLIV